VSTARVSSGDRIKYNFKKCEHSQGELRWSHQVVWAHLRKEVKFVWEDCARAFHILREHLMWAQPGWAPGRLCKSFPYLERTFDVSPGVGTSGYVQVIWGLQWCFEHCSQLRSNARKSGHCLCFTGTSTSRNKLSYSWLELAVVSQYQRSRNLYTLPFLALHDAFFKNTLMRRGRWWLS
jgi:hypothetical protein